MNFIPTSSEDWSKSDTYHNKFLLAKDPALEACLENSRSSGLPGISVSAAQGKFLSMVARSVGVRRILEVGTLGGYSTIWLARALPEDGKLITLEIDPERAAVAQKNIELAGLASKVEIIIGPAAETLKALTPDEPFDFAFIDADKPNILIYYLEAKRLSKKGAILIVDNVVRWAQVALQPEDTDDENVKGVRKLLTYLKDNKEIEATTLGLVGDKGYDGMLFSTLQ